MLKLCLSVSRRKATVFSVQQSSCVSTRHVRFVSILAISMTSPKCSMNQPRSCRPFTMRKTPDCITKLSMALLAAMFARAPTTRCRVSSGEVEMRGKR